jgi:hypothetical protein
LVELGGMIPARKKTYTFFGGHREKTITLLKICSKVSK